MLVVHVVNKKTFLKQRTPTSWRSRLQKEVSSGVPLYRARKYQNILCRQHLNATNERHEILSVRSASTERPHRRARAQPGSNTGKYGSASSSDPTLSNNNLVFLCFVSHSAYSNSPPCTNAQSVSSFSHTHSDSSSLPFLSLLHIPLVFTFFFYINLTLPLLRLSPPLSFSLSISLATVFCHGCYLFPCRAVCLL